MAREPPPTARPEAAMIMTSTCGICGDRIESRIPASWHPSKLARRAEWDMQAHLKTHSFAEVLRFEIRQDLDQVPDDERATIVRDIYRNLLGKASDTGYVLGDTDSLGVYSIDEVLGDLNVYQLWRSANRCGQQHCAH
ncbi:MAG TPA: hypothetical protein VGL99_14465 [Chloroflexota bacterium]